MPPKKSSASWGFIILMLFLFFPVGIWLLWKKLSGERYNSLKNGKHIRLLGWILFGLGVFYLLMGLAGGWETNEKTSILGGILVGLLFFCGGGILLVLWGRKLVKSGTKYERYLTIIRVQDNYSIDNIAAAYPVPYEQACADLQNMIEMGYFPHLTRVDFNRRELILPEALVSSDREETAERKSRALTCPNCGAPNVIESDNGECEYCGSPLFWEKE